VRIRIHSFSLESAFLIVVSGLRVFGLWQAQKL
jgi:hypothetical protein